MKSIRSASFLLLIKLISAFGLSLATAQDQRREGIIQAQRQEIGASVCFDTWGITEQEMEKTFATSENLICLMEFGGYFKRLNANWSKVLGWEIEELLRTPYYEFIHPDDLQKTLEYESNFIPSGFINRYHCKDGSYRWLSWIGLSNLEIAGGQPSFAIVMDVTLDELLKQKSVQQISLLNEHVNFQTSVIKAITEVQRLYLGQLGQYGNEPDKVISFQHIIQHFITLSQSEFGFIERIVSNKSKHASTKIWEIDPLADPKAQQLFERCKIEEEGLLYFNKLVEQVVSQNSPLIINNIEDYFKETGPSESAYKFTSFFGIPLTSRNEMVGILALANRPTGYNEQLLEWFEPLLLLTSRIVNEVNLISAYKKMRKASLSQEKAEAKNEAKSAFLAHMSHELRTPLGGLIGLLSLIPEEQLSSENLSYLQMAKETGNTLLIILNDILDLSKIEEGKLILEKIAFNPLQVAQGVVKLLAFSAKDKALKLKLKCDSLVPESVIGDPKRLRQILMNLVGNAIKFTEKGNVKITLDGHYGQDGSKYILNSTVKDTGIGINPDTLSRLFQPFSQADESIARRYQGTGLGLYITKSFCELMGGSIKVKSEEGKGSSFSFEAAFEVPEEDRSLGSPPPSSEALLKLPSLHILVAEDNRTNQILLRVMLERSGCTVTIAVNGHEALKAIEREKFDLILMDGQMPEMDGLEATRRIREHYNLRELPIIGVTAHAMKTDKKRFLEVGMNSYLTKPINKKALYKKILKCLEEK
ncbi:response regulator [Candidatus Odyssella acanthamoebae]|uniref:response regulator n=1 Tax=Candidatus Odyssella acanthamoebae TaxID=91604 RepID=UPI00068EDD99|nr:response regulator [Candidatus Paracaedibacter acanthamoebae]